MYGLFQLSGKFFIHWLTASSGKGHGIHSPFVYDFVVSVLADKKEGRSVFQPIESVRRSLEKDRTGIRILDLGAGSVIDNQKERTVASIARNAAKSDRFGRLFYRMVKHYGIEPVLQLGTSLGLSTRYFAAADPKNGVVSIEGAPELAAFTKQCIDQEHYRNVKILVGDFQVLLPDVLPGLKGRKLIFVDGNHRYQATKDYFLQSLKYIGEDDMLIFDDIHWSEEMEKIWAEIKNHQEVSCTIDLFFIGIVFFKKEFKEKQHFSIRF